jgi:hypothetical protein
MNVREMITANLLVKFLALFLAVVLCLFVWLETGVEEDVVVPLRLVNIPAGLRVQEPVLPEITLHLSGPRIMLLRQRWQGEPLTLDLAGGQTGNVFFSRAWTPAAPCPGGKSVECPAGNTAVDSRPAGGITGRSSEGLPQR